MSYQDLDEKKKKELVWVQNGEKGKWNLFYSG